MLQNLAYFSGPMSDFDKTSEEADELYEEFKLQDLNKSPFTFSFDGKKVNSFEELVALESTNRSSKLSELVEEITNYEKDIAEHESYFDENYEGLNEDMEEVLKDMDEMDDEIQDMQILVQKSTDLLQQKKDTVTAKDTHIEQETRVQKMVSEFIEAFVVVCLIGLMCGMTCICCVMQNNKRRQQQRKAKAQANPAFKFADSTDPSASSGGIPAMNAIPDDELNKPSPQKSNQLQVDTDNGDNMMTERGLFAGSPDKLTMRSQFKSPEKLDGALSAHPPADNQA